MSDYTHWVKAHSGIQLEFVEELKKRLEDEVESDNHHCAILMDEMKIKSGLVFNKHSGRLTGFVDLGDVNRDMEQLLGTDDKQPPQLADQVLIFMAQAVFRPSLTMPNAHYFSCNLRGKYSCCYGIHSSIYSVYHVKLIVCHCSGENFSLSIGCY